MFGLRDPRTLEEWEQGVLASRLLFIICALALVAAYFQHGVGQTVLIAVGVSSLVGAFASGFTAQRLYRADPDLGGDD